MRFYLGVLLVILSFVIGKITTATVVIYFENMLIKWASIIVYILSWPMLIIGFIWIGEEYSASIRKYISYRFYHESVKKGTRNVVCKTKNKSKVIKDKISPKINKVKNKIKIKKNKKSL